MISWLLLSLAAALLWAIVNVNDKYIISGLKIPPRISLIGSAVVGIISSLIVFGIKGISTMSFFHTTLALLAGAFFILMLLFYYEATKREEISRVVPLFGLSPLFVLVGATLWLKEVLSVSQYVGIFIIVIAAIMISLENIKKFKITHASFLMIFSALAWAFHQIIVEYLVRFNDFWTVFSYIRIGALLVLLPEIIFYIPLIKKIYKNKGIIPFALLGMSESLYVVGLLLASAAASVGLASLVNGVLAIQPLFVLVITSLLSFLLPGIIKEKTNKNTMKLKFAAIILMVVGTIFVS